jgi:hypothetical protein
MDQMLLRRIAGLALILVFLLTFNHEHATPLRTALLAMAVIGLWLAIANVTAVALTVGLLAAFNTRFGHSDPVVAWVYPALAAGALMVFVASVIRRFVTHMHDTHQERWARRRARDERDPRNPRNPRDDDAERR